MITTSLLLAAGLLCGAAADEDATVDFQRDVAPVLARSCVKCHSGPQAKGGLRMETRELLLEGGDAGAVVVVGKAAESRLLELVRGLDPDLVMPAQGPRLTAAQVEVLRRWIDQGLAWQAGFRFAASQSGGLRPRRPPLPAAAGAADNPIDLLLQDYYRRHDVAAADVVDDRVFARRVYLDLVGLLPPPEPLAQFERDPRADKRRRLVRQLLDDRQAYAEHWLTFWNDVLRNAYRGTGFIDGGRQQISPWLFTALYENKPYDRFVHELITPAAGAEGFTKGIIWRGVVNASQRPEMQAAQNVAQVFMGTNLKCASCHDSFVNHWQLTDSYALAAVFADGPLEIHRCNKPTGELARVAFIYPQLGVIDPGLPKAQRMRQLADIVTSPDNGRLARTMVNRLWAWCFGRGIVEPLDDLDQPAWHTDLLDWLAADLQDHDYDLKHTLELICTSRAYGRPAVGAPRPDEDEFVFRGPLVRRMTAEQFVDAVATVTGVWPAKPAFQPALPGAAATAVPAGTTAKWLWSHAAAHTSDPGGRIFLRRDFQLGEPPAVAIAALTCDNEFTLLVNGKRVAAGANWQSPLAVDLAPHLVEGHNTLAVEAINYPDPVTKKGLEFQGANPAGLVLVAALRFGEDRWDEIVSDRNWLVATELQAGWAERDFDTRGWRHAAELGGYKMNPWRVGEALLAQLNRSTAVAGGDLAGIRTALVNDDPLTRALGRPNREQVVTRRDSLATTLQALELTNGQTLDEMLAKGARHWLRQPAASTPELVNRLFAKALGRAPTEDELAAAAELLGPQPGAEGVHDLLWILTMLPEFQLIY